MPTKTKEDIENQIEITAANSGKYKSDAYRYTIQVLGDIFSLKKAISSKEEEISLPAREVLRGLKIYGWMYYGLLAGHVFETWGLRHGKDFGEIIFDLVDAGFIGKGPSETVKDYDEGFDFDWDYKVFWDMETNEDVIKHITSYID
jgi:uncharacterized repeat protein (TIGR04138 family)